ncbi:ectoine hydroxylase-related dioxygenase (phytanoyl-CoA dioxygenase family) [Paenibacillus taihuensis]|uniref:Ectoine hydroxylase-related dioxygenase (Phytanoyl-CoA dioxygenase family) n=1 Tax=Paenibacillus taihuensis TaxID=1156355 RepID=A0A3D9SFD5_9BACL|nr:phytanoyl-CoA dioxygenase family protein [Paenibacillus taihuensis]REE94609.1 ectoine hydroxylase-related dioxygenase (phytanoyl-CoA dioxygenase family) [Paenibacillus taihuensis]
MMLNAEQLKHYEEQGYVILENLFSNEEMDRIRSIIDVFDWEGEEALKVGSKGFNNIPNQINFTCNLARRHENLEQFICDRRFVDLTTTVLGPDIRLYWDQSVYKRPEADRDFPWHQDNGYVPTDPVEYMTCWLALEDATLENGCIWIQPESHKKGFVEHKKTDIGWQCYFGEDPGMPVPLRKGSMVIFNSLLFHRSTPNRSQGTRKAYVIQYSVEGVKNPDTGVVFDNGPLIAVGGKQVIA